MNIKKIGSGLVVAMSMLAFNAAASDKCDTEIEDIKRAADNLRCSLAVSDDFGYPGNPVYRQADEPVDLITEGARWYDTDDNNTSYVYLSGAWVSQTIDNIGLWNHAPIWQKAAGKGKGKNSDSAEPGDGCEVHQKLARLLYEKPVEKVSNGKGGNKPNDPDNQLSRGAARALEDHQYVYAVQLLEEFVTSTSVENSVVNPDPDWGTHTIGTVGPNNAQEWADFAKLWAQGKIVAIEGENGVGGCANP